jgi:hypothetical protein
MKTQGKIQTLIVKAQRSVNDYPHPLGLKPEMDKTLLVTADPSPLTIAEVFIDIPAGQANADHLVHCWNNYDSLRRDYDGLLRVLASLLVKHGPQTVDPAFVPLDPTIQTTHNPLDGSILLELRS